MIESFPKFTAHFCLGEVAFPAEQLKVENNESEQKNHACCGIKSIYRIIVQKDSKIVKI